MSSLIVVCGLAVMIGVIWNMYHVLEGMFERNEPPLPAMMSLAASFVISELGVAVALNTLIEAVFHRPSELLSMEISRVQQAGAFPVVMLVAVVWYIWSEKHLHRRLLPVLLAGTALSVLVLRY